MKLPQNDEKNYIDVKVYKDFYFNKNLGLPTIIKEYERLENILITNQYLACITAKVAENWSQRGEQSRESPRPE